MTAYEVMGSHCNDESQTSKKNCLKKLTKGKKKSQANEMLRFLRNKQFQIVLTLSTSICPSSKTPPR